VSIAVTIAGPASPRALVDWLDASDRERALITPGSGGRSVNNLVRALLEAGASVELVTLDEAQSDRVTFEGPRLRILSAPYRVRARWRSKDFFRAERRHVEELVAETSGFVVDAHWTYEYALGALSSPDRPTLVTARDNPFAVLRHTPDLYRLIRAAMSVATRLRGPALAANSPYLARAWRQQLLYRRAIALVPNAVPALSVNGSRQNAAPVILDVSSSSRLKNTGALVQAMPEILRRRPDARMRLVGPGLDGGSDQAELAERLGVREAIDFGGEIAPEAVADEYGRATMLVHPSLEESFGLSVAEAMSHGLPVVGGAGAGAVPWLLDGGRAGLLVDVRSPDAIAEGVCRVLDDVSLREELGSAAMKRASEFSAESVAVRALAVYETVARSHR
jgi:glycosyltransferase involved in cell wall biosynthesis